jgi:putative ABC transport system substrate-binding protein
LVIEIRDAEQYDRLPAILAELVLRQVALIVTASNVNAALAAKGATTTIPIVFTLGTDPVRLGVVASLNRPGSNITGVTYYSNELTPKRLELLRELVPAVPKIAFLLNPTNPATELYRKELQAAARSVGQEMIVLNASTADEIDTAFARLVRDGVGGLVINGDAFFTGRRDQLVALAAQHRIPAVHFDPSFTSAGGLMSYSDDRMESWRQAGNYAGRVLRGEKPADMPVLQPTKFELIINLKAAKAISLAIPPSLLARADEVIE